MSERRYIRNCDFCNEVYVAKSLKSRFHSDKCRCANRRNSQQQVKSGEAVENKKSDDQITKEDYSPPATPVDPKPLEKPSTKKRNTYTEQDVWILLGRICDVGMTSSAVPLLHDLHVNRLSDNIIADFEKRFNCTLEEVRKEFPHIKPGETNAVNQAIVKKYWGLGYSK